MFLLLSFVLLISFTLSFVFLVKSLCVTLSHFHRNEESLSLSLFIPQRFDRLQPGRSIGRIDAEEDAYCRRETEGQRDRLH